MNGEKMIVNRPYVICHMLTSIDGKVTGDFLFSKSCAIATEEYYAINREYHADAYACGRVTMEESFTKGLAPDLSKCVIDDGEHCVDDFVSDDAAGFFAVAFDPHARLGWTGSRIVDEDVGYGNAHIIEVLCENIDFRYTEYLKKLNISYIFAGKECIDVPLALEKLYGLFGIKTLLLEGGSIINGAFAAAGVIDEISLVSVPTVAGEDSKPLFMKSVITDYSMERTERLESGALRLVYKR